MKLLRRTSRRFGRSYEYNLPERKADRPRVSYRLVARDDRAASGFRRSRGDEEGR